MKKRGRPEKFPKKVRTRSNVPNPYPRRESKNVKYAYGVFRRYRDEVKVCYEYDGSTTAKWRHVNWSDLPEDVKQFPEIAELAPKKKLS